MEKTLRTRAVVAGRPPAISHVAPLRYFVLALVCAFIALSAFPEASFWVSIGLLGYTYLGYPLLLGMIALLRRSPEDAIPHLPAVSILIAAHNEEQSIEQTVRNALKLDYPRNKLEVVVISDGSTDRTDEIVEAIADPRVRSLRLPKQSGKTEAQNRAVQVCKGEIVVFSDATTVYDPQAIRYLVRHYRDHRVGAVSGHYEYIRPDLATSAAIGTAIFWRYENIVKRLQSKAGTMTGCSGCIYSVRRCLYTPLPPESCSDLVEPLAIVRKGRRVVFEPRALAFETCSATVTEEFRMRVRVTAHGIDSLIANSDLLNVFRHGWVSLQLLSHKVLRWMTPVFLLNALAMSAVLMARPVFRNVFIAQALFYGVSLLLAVAPRRGRWRMLGIPFQFCALHAAVIVGVKEVISGKVYAVWRPVRN